jgi:vacuolar protein sorting-associated protein 33A
MNIIAEHIIGLRGSKQPKTFHVYFVPRKTMICERVLEEKGVYGSVNIGEFQLDLIPFDDDVLSLELEWGYKELFLVSFLIS